MRWDAFDASYYAWKTWFAWYPVVIKGECVWLEKVQRRFHENRLICWYEYRNN